MSSASGPLQAGVLIIGNEILSGRTQDKNLPFLAQRLNALGINLAQAWIIPDKEDEIIKAVQIFHEKYDYVFTTGGIGPTHDDITAVSIAKAFNLPCVMNDDALARLKQRYGDDLNEARLKMAYMPQGSKLIDNPVSHAPGCAIKNVFIMAGVPDIMQAMFDSIAPTLKTGQPICSQTVSCYLAESKIAAPLEAIQNTYPQVDIGSYPFWGDGKHGTSIVIRGTDQVLINRAAEEVADAMRAQGQTPVFEKSAGV